MASTAIGFTIIRSGSPDNIESARLSLGRALAHFENLGQLTINIGETELHLWGRDELTDCLHYLPNGSLLVRVGSPIGETSWQILQEKLYKAARPSDFELPWDGRAILLKISADGNHWTLWNDWLGSIPVFHTSLGAGHIASTLEPIVVAAAGFTPQDISLRGLVYLLIHGHFSSDWTLFNDMKAAPPDCVAEWKGGRFYFKPYNTVRPTDNRWEEGRDELIDEMHHLSRQAIVDVLKTQPTWILPLSGGLDSRYIAAVGASYGVDMYTYTWGARQSTDATYARQIARALDLPWKWIDLGTDYMKKYTRLWSELFGSAMQFHGMYQMPFYDALKSEPSGPIVSGFIGESLAGYDVRFQALLHSSADRIHHSCPEGYTNWAAKDIQMLLKVPVDGALEEVAAEIERQKSAVPGPWFQRLRFINLWGRQRRFTYFQSALCDLWRGVATPYLNRAYARFCMSLPRAVLDERQLQKDVFRRYYGNLAVISGSYANEPILRSGRYLLKQRIAKMLPDPLTRGPFQGFDRRRSDTDVDCIRSTGWSSLWPMCEAWDNLGEWFELEQITASYQAAINGDQRSVRKLNSVQVMAYHLQNAFGN